MFTVLFFKCVFFKFSSKKILLNKFSPFPKTNKQFYRYRSIPLFFFYVYCICWEASFHYDIKSNDGFFTANRSGCGEWYHRECINIQVKVFLR